jgi:hypothetical protein
MNTNIQIYCHDDYETSYFIFVIVDENDNEIFEKSLINSLDKVILELNEFERFELYLK